MLLPVGFEHIEKQSHSLCSFQLELSRSLGTSHPHSPDLSVDVKSESRID